MRTRTRPTPALALAALALACALASPSWLPAFSIKNNPNTNFDDKVVLSPAAERIQKVEPENKGADIGPGMTVQRPVLLQNRTRRKLGFDIEISQVVGSNAEEVVEVRHGVRKGAAAWSEIDRKSLELKPGDTATLLLTIRIPKDAKPGSKAFAVTVTQRQSAQPTEGAGVQPIFRQVAIFIVDLPGQAPIKGTFTRADIHSASDTVDEAGKRVDQRRIYVGDHRLILTLEYRNDGERLLTPQGSVEVRDVFKRVVARYKVDRFTVYPEGEAATDIDLRKLPKIGLFRSRIVLTSDAGEQVKKIDWFLLMPRWLFLAICGLVLYVAGRTALHWWRERKLREELGDDWEDEEVDEDDDLDPDVDDDDDPSYEPGRY